MMANSKKMDAKLLTAVLYIVIGVLFCIFRAALLQWLLTIVGVLFVVQGVLSLVKKDMVSGAVSLVIGLLLIIGGWTFVEVIMIVFGVLMIVKGVLDLLEALKRKNNVVPIVFACLTLAVGVLLIVSRWAMLDWLFILIGVFFIADGVLGLLGKSLK